MSLWALECAFEAKEVVIMADRVIEKRTCFGVLFEFQGKTIFRKGNVLEGIGPDRYYSCDLYCYRFFLYPITPLNWLLPNERPFFIGKQF